MKFEIEFPDIAFNEKFAEDDLVQVMGQELQTQRTLIVSNLNQGKGADGDSLRPYSDAYEKLKAGSGRSTTPNLNWSGELHRSMDVKTPKSIRDAGEITFKGTHKGGFSNAGLAASLNARGFTGWFQFGQSGLDRIQKAIMSAIDKNLKKAVDVKSKGAPQ